MDGKIKFGEKLSDAEYAKKIAEEKENLIQEIKQKKIDNLNKEEIEEE